jgi:hypothetical protein
MNVTLLTITCRRCGHRWIPRVRDVRRCPRSDCQSIYFDRRQRRRPEKGSTRTDINDTGSKGDKP